MYDSSTSTRPSILGAQRASQINTSNSAMSRCGLCAPRTVAKSSACCGPDVHSCVRRSPRPLSERVHATLRSPAVHPWRPRKPAAVDGDDHGAAQPPWRPGRPATIGPPVPPPATHFRHRRSAISDLRMTPRPPDQPSQQPPPSEHPKNLTFSTLCTLHCAHLSGPLVSQTTTCLRWVRNYARLSRRFGTARDDFDQLFNQSVMTSSARPRLPTWQC